MQKLLLDRIVRKCAATVNRALTQGSAKLQRVEDHLTSRIVAGHDGVLSVPAYLVATAPRLRPMTVAPPRPGQRPAIVVFGFLDSAGFFGGIATLLMAGAMLARELDYDLCVVQTISFTPDADVPGFLAGNGIPFDAARYRTEDLSRRSSGHDDLPLADEDIILVSAWWDAHVAARLNRPRKFVYLVQDYEPIFYGNSDDMVRAEATYHSGKFLALINSSVLAEFFASEGYDFVDEAVVFEPAVSTREREQRASGSHTLFLYGRPEVGRNLFRTALEAVDKAFADGDFDSSSWRICVAGSDAVPSLRLTNGLEVERLGKMTLGEYYAFVSTVDVAVSPMLAPHPNYPTLEFASVGARVVTTRWRSKTDLSRYGGDIQVVPATVDDLARGIVRACSQPVAQPHVVSPFFLGRSWMSALATPAQSLATGLRRSLHGEQEG